MSGPKQSTLDRIQKGYDDYIDPDELYTIQELLDIFDISDFLWYRFFKNDDFLDQDVLKGRNRHCYYKGYRILQKIQDLKGQPMTTPEEVKNEVIDWRKKLDDINDSML